MKNRYSYFELEPGKIYATNSFSNPILGMYIKDVKFGTHTNGSLLFLTNRGFENIYSYCFAYFELITWA